MKKIFFFVLVLGFSLSKSASAQVSQFANQQKPKVYWKHHDCSWQGGFCVRHIFPLFTPESGDQLQPGEGTFNYDLVAGKFRVVFDGTGGPVADIFSVDDGVIIPNGLAGTLGYTTINLTGGNYQVDYSNPKFAFGFVLIDCTLVK